MGYGARFVQRVPTIVFLLGLAAFGMGRRASRTGAGGQIPNWVGVLLLVAGVGLWVVINVVVGIGLE